MSDSPIIERAARVIARAVVHGTSDDVAREIAQALAAESLLAHPAAPLAQSDRSRPVPTPAAVAMLARCNRAKAAATRARAEVTAMPGEPKVDTAGGEVTFVVRPESLADWNQWLRALGVRDPRAVQHGSSSTTARCTYRGVPTRLVGINVPALVGAALRGSAAGS